MTEETSTPGYERLQALRKAAATNGRLVQASRPLSEYLALTQRLHAAFHRAVDDRQVDAAYVYGLRLANLAIESLPRHPEWKQPHVVKERRRLTSQVDRVLSRMELLKQRITYEEMLRQQQQREEQEKEQQIEVERKREQEVQRKRIEEAHRRLEEERQRHLDTEKKEQEQQAAARALQQKQQKREQIQQSAIAKLQALQAKSNVSMDTNKQEAATAQLIQVSTKQSNESTQQLDTEHPPQASSEPGNVSSDPVPSSLVPSPIKESISGMTPMVGSSPKLERKMTPRSSKEQATIDLLQRAIRSQEKRIEHIEIHQIPQLLRAAKEYFKYFRKETGEKDLKTKNEKFRNNPNRRAAVQCLARKKKLERQLDSSKAAVFQMETQMFMLENAMEDRQVQTTLSEASQAIASLQQIAKTDESLENFADDMADALTSDKNIPALDQDEEEELLEELNEWITSLEVDNETSKSDHTSTLADDNMGVLALPPGLSTPLPSITNEDPVSSGKEPLQTQSSSTKGLMKAVLG